MLVQGGFAPPRPPGAEFVQSHPELLDGTPVFVGTRVPVKNLFDCLTGGHPLTVFLEQFPTVSREQALAALDWSRRSLESLAHARAAETGPVQVGA